MFLLFQLNIFLSLCIYLHVFIFLTKYISISLYLFIILTTSNLQIQVDYNILIYLN